MKKKVLVTAAATVFLLGAAGSAIMLNTPKKNVALIKRDNKILYSIDLKTAEDKTFDIKYSGSVNTIEIKDGRIRVKDADCPDKVCVKTGWLSSSAIPIVCLPHHLVIEFENNVEVDAAAK